MPHFEAVVVERAGVPDPEIFHVGRWRPITQAFDHLLDGSGITFDMRLDMTVRAVPDPSLHTKSVSLITRPGSKEDSLHTPCNRQMASNGRHYTVAMSGASSAFMPTTL